MDMKTLHLRHLCRRGKNLFLECKSGIREDGMVPYEPEQAYFCALREILNGDTHAPFSENKAMRDDFIVLPQFHT